MVRPLLSVVMPVHGGEHWLDAALASVVAGPDATVEVVIRDSTPGRSCEHIVRRHEGRLPIDYLYMPEVASWTRKTNMAVEAATASHVAMLHQDDLWLPGRAEIAAEMIANDPEATLLLTPARIVDAHGRKLGLWRAPFRAGPVDGDTFRKALLVQNSIALPAPIMRRDAYLAVGGLDESLWYTPDWDLWLKLAEQGSVVYDPRPASGFRIHSNSLTMTGNRREFADQLEIVLNRHLGDQKAVASICRASAKINVHLANAAGGAVSSAFAALWILLSLGPHGIVHYVHASRIIDRVLPRLRARLSGAF